MLAPAVPPRVALSARSHVGRVRARNEDFLAIREPEGWAFLADGMGGYRGGDVAARLSVDAACVRLEREKLAGRLGVPDAVAHVLWQAAADANGAILREAAAHPELTGMGSTLVAAVFLADCAVSMHVGDSRLYRYRAGRLVLLTRDHTMLQDLVESGILSPEEAAKTHFRGLLTRGLGVAATVVPEIGVHEALRGDLFLLCSDGLTDMLDDAEITAVITAQAGAPLVLDELTDRLIELANRKGGKDNVSVILAHVGQ